MAKHTHKLILMNKKTWRCALPGCSYFLHTGLEHLLPGKPIKCWGCGDDFNVTESALGDARNGDDMPKCANCTMGRDTGTSTGDMNDMSDMIDLKTKVTKFGVSKVSEMDPNRLRTMINMGHTTQRAVDLALGMEKEMEAQSSNQIIPSKSFNSSKEFHHLSDCATSLGMECDCRDEIK